MATTTTQEPVNFQYAVSRTGLYKVRTHAKLGRLAFLKGWGWYLLDSDNNPVKVVANNWAGVNRYAKKVK